MHSSEILTKMKLSDVFHLPKTFGNFHGKVHRVKNVFYLTQVAFVYDLVTKIQDGTTDIAVNNLKLVILCEWNMLFHHKISTGKQECLFQNSTYSANFPVERSENVCSIKIATGISR